MIILELMFAVLWLSLAVITSYSDCRYGIIRNRTLGAFLFLGVLMDGAYYGAYAGKLLPSFLMNLLVIAAVSLYLFYSHSFAGGDCKLVMVMALLYPARFLMSYGKTDITLIFSLGFAILYGYGYLVLSSLKMLISGRNRISGPYVRQSLIQFAKSFVSASVYICAVHTVLLVPEYWGVHVPYWLSCLSGIGVAWCVGRYGWLKKWYLVLPVFAADMLSGIFTGIFPFSVHPENYVLVLVLLLCRMTVSTNLYEQIPVAELRPGMILSSFSSAMMQNSRVKGLPGLSSENLGNRLTEGEVQAVGRWAGSKKVESVSVVKKIPFALFISLGYLSYFLLWSWIR